MIWVHTAVPARIQSLSLSLKKQTRLNRSYHNGKKKKIKTAQNDDSQLYRGGLLAHRTAFEWPVTRNKIWRKRLGNWRAVSEAREQIGQMIDLFNRPWMSWWSPDVQVQSHHQDGGRRGGREQEVHQVHTVVHNDEKYINYLVHIVNALWYYRKSITFLFYPAGRLWVFNMKIIINEI